MKQYFITGTDTGVGKTTVTCLLLKLLKQQGFKTVALKPVASGCEEDSAGNLVSDDALNLQAEITQSIPYSQINLISLQPPIAPHIAAAEIGLPLTKQMLVEKTTPIFSCPADYLLVEGAGGWMTPLNEEDTLADYVVHYAFEVILVVGMRLGCVNHALLTVQSVLSKNLKLAGWVANCIDKDMLYLEQNLISLKRLIPAPCLGVIPFGNPSAQLLTIPH